MTKQVIILFGPPGAGKGTQSELLSEKMGLYLFETSGLLEKSFAAAKKEEFIEIDGEKFYFQKEKELKDSVVLCSPQFVIHLVIGKIQELYKEGRSIIFTGSPRTAYEVEKMIPVLENLYGKENIKVVLLQISPEETVTRNSTRKMCQLMRHSILSNKETKNLTICPLDGSKFLDRSDDNPEAIKVRLKEYKERTLPVVEYFEKNKFQIHKINGEQSVSDVFQDVLKALK